MGDAWKDIEYTFSEEELYGNKLCVSALVPDYPTEYLPQKKTSGAAGYDLVSIQEKIGRASCRERVSSPV